MIENENVVPRLTPRARVLCAVVVVVAVALRLSGVSELTRVYWDEKTPDAAVFLSKPFPYLVDMFGDSLGRPGLDALKLIGMLFAGMMPGSLPQSVSRWPVAFQILLDVSSSVLLMDLVRRFVLRGKSHAYLAGCLAGIVWATSPTIVRYSHRMLPPTYACFMYLLSMWVVYRACLLKGGRSAFLVAGASVGLAFMTYPGIYHMLLFLPLLLLDRRIRAGVSREGVVSFAAGVLMPILLFQVAMVCVKTMRQPQYFTYFRQLALVSRCVVHGDTKETIFFPFLFGLDNREFWMPILFIAIVGAVSRRNWECVPWALTIVGVYSLWQVNGAILGREVIYGRTVVLLFPAAAIAIGASLSTLLSRLRASRTVLVLVLAASGALSAWIVITGAFRDCTRAIRADISTATGFGPDDFTLVDGVNDYSYYAGAGYKQLVAMTETGKTVFVAFNLKAMSHVQITNRLEFPLDPVLRYPSPIRYPYLQYEGHSGTERDFIRNNPRLFDIKVFTLDDLKGHPPQHVSGEPK